MGFFSRLSNIVSSKANKALDKVENPIEQIELAIRKREEAMNDAKLKSASFIGSINQKKREKEELLDKIKQYEEGIRQALQAGDEEKAKRFLTNKKELDQSFLGTEKTIETLSATAEKVKRNIDAIEKEVKELKMKKSELTARYSTAQAQAKVNEILTDLNKDSNISLADIEQKVADAENYADGLESFKEVDMDEELSQYLAKGTDESMEDELNKYR